MPKTTRSLGLSELRVGLLVFASIAILIFLILNASGELNPFATKLHLRARFQDANGLREGSEVRLAGVRIGKVDQVKLLSPTEAGAGNEPNPPKVEALLSINEKIDGLPATESIRTDSTAHKAAPCQIGHKINVTIHHGTVV